MRGRGKRWLRIVAAVGLCSGWSYLDSTVAHAGFFYSGSLGYETDCCQISGSVTNCTSDPEQAWDSIAGFYTCDDACNTEYPIWLNFHCDHFTIDSCESVSCDSCYTDQCDENLPCCSEGASCVNGFCEG